MVEEERMKDRFECLMDPCGRYLVWDNEGDAPAMHGQAMLACASAEEAMRLAAAMNARAARRGGVATSFRNAFGAPSGPRPLRLVSDRP